MIKKAKAALLEWYNYPNGRSDDELAKPLQATKAVLDFLVTEGFAIECRGGFYPTDKGVQYAEHLTDPNGSK